MTVRSCWLGILLLVAGSIPPARGQSSRLPKPLPLVNDLTLGLGTQDLSRIETAVARIRACGVTPCVVVYWRDSTDLPLTSDLMGRLAAEHRTWTGLLLFFGRDRRGRLCATGITPTLPLVVDGKIGGSSSTLLSILGTTGSRTIGTEVADQVDAVADRVAASSWSPLWRALGMIGFLASFDRLELMLGILAAMALVAGWVFLRDPQEPAPDPEPGGEPRA